MSRTVDDWVGATDDAAIPPRVKDRLLWKHGDACAECREPFGPKRKAEFDHLIPLIVGGAHAEHNLRPLCSGCHAVKTKFDVALKAKVASVRKAHLGISTPSRTPLAGGRASPWKRTIGGKVVRRDDA